MRSKTKRPVLYVIMIIIGIHFVSIHLANAAEENLTWALSVKESKKDLKFYCPTDIWAGNLDKETLKKIGKVGGVTALAACTLVAPVCILAGEAGGLGYIIYKAVTDKSGWAKKNAEAACANIPGDVASDQKMMWQITCQKVAYSANLDAAENSKERMHSWKEAPFQLNDDITTWVANGTQVKHVSALIDAQSRLRKENFTSCLSDPSVVDAIEKSQSLTLRQATDLMLANTTKHGVRIFNSAENPYPGNRSVFHKKSLNDLNPADLKHQAQIFLAAWEAGRLASYSIYTEDLIKLDTWMLHPEKTATWTVAPTKEDRTALAWMAWSWSLTQQQKVHPNYWFYTTDELVNWARSF